MSKWTDKQWLDYYDHLVEFLYQSLGAANDDIMDMADEYARAKAGLE